MWSISSFFRSFAHFLDRGHAVVSLEYRYACHGATARDMVDDVHDALAFLAAEAGNLGLDLARTTLTGESAGY